MKTLITICARAGSKGIPGKNTKLLNGIPLVEYTIKMAFEFTKKIDAKIAISTDDENIKNIAKFFEIETSYCRPAHLATDNAGKVETIFDILKYEENKSSEQFDYILDLDVTSPLRTLEDLHAGFNIILENTEILNLFSVNNANKNPYFNMVEQKDDGYFKLVKEGNFLTRQSASKVYELNASFYFYKRDFFNNPNAKVINDRSFIYLMPHICFDLDHIIDFDFLEFLVKNNKINFNF
jgi:CMP-N,N'-diacetyllegionaminic acid synthase